MLYAVKSGLYRKYGLDVQVVKLAGAAAVTSALVGGSLEVGKAATLTITTAITKGIPITLVGNLSYYESAKPDIAILALASSNIRSAKDFDGKTLAAVSLQDTNSIATIAWLDKAGIDRSRVKFVEVPQGAVLAAMEAGRVDGGSIFEPYLASYLATGKVRIVGYPHDAIARKYSNSVLCTGTKWAETHRDTLQRFLRASEEASTYIAGHDNVSSELIAESRASTRHAREHAALALASPSIRPISSRSSMPPPSTTSSPTSHR